MSRDAMDPGTRRVLSRDQMLAVGHKVLGLLDEERSGIVATSVTHSARAVTKVSDGKLLNTVDGDEVEIQVMSRFGSGLSVWISTNQLDDTTLRHALGKISEMTPPATPANEQLADDPDDQRYYTFNARPIPPVSLWHDATIGAMETARGTVLPSMIETLRRSNLSGAATIGLVARSTMHLYRLGLTAFSEETDSEVSVTARLPVVGGTGWSGQAHRDWAHVDPQAVTARAVLLAEQSRGIVAYEPGRHTAILGPAAVAQLVVAMAQLFSGNATNSPGVVGTPFTYVNHDVKGRHNRLHERVFDPRIMMVSDPADPLGGFPPFFEPGGEEIFLFGFPTPACTWIDRGVLTNLAYGASDALGRQLSPAQLPYSVRLSPAPGTQTATIEEMIAHCDNGIYVNRFSNVELLDRATGMMTGVTRDGCFLVKNGKIAKPIKNFRFTDSPWYTFNQLEMIGTAERVAFGYTSTPGASESWERRRRWPKLPVIVPPMMVRDFNFSGMTDAV